MSKPFLKFAVIGDPVAHSQSPEIHAKFLAQAKLAGSYDAIKVRSGDAAVQLSALHAAGYLGLNVTTPLKEQVVPLLDSYDDMVERIGAANTLTATAKGWRGSNTDGSGVCAALSLLLPATLLLETLRVLVLGTGPTARAAIASLLERGTSVSLWSRRAERASRTAQALGAVVWCGPEPLDAIVSTLPPQPDLSPELLAQLQKTSLIIDANYGSRATLQQLTTQPVTDGLLMLRAQAWSSFCLWKKAFVEVAEFGEGEI